MLSTPPATAASVSPSRMYCAAETIACMPLPQSRFSVSAPVSCGRPPFTHASREMYMSLRLGVDHVAEHALADLVRVDLRPADRLAHHARGEIAGRDVLQAAAVIADARCVRRSG